VRSFTETIEANRHTGFLLACRELLVMAIRDPRLYRAHLQVLAVLVEHIDEEAGYTYVGRERIADALSVSVKTVSNLIAGLKECGYILAERQSVPAAGKTLMTYTIAELDRATIREAIALWCEATRKGGVPDRRGTRRVPVPGIQGTQRGRVPDIQGTRDQSSRHTGNSHESSRPAGNSVPDIQGTQGVSSRYTGHSKVGKKVRDNTTTNLPASAPTNLFGDLPEQAGVVVAPSGITATIPVQLRDRSTKMFVRSITPAEIKRLSTAARVREADGLEIARAVFQQWVAARFGGGQDWVRHFADEFKRRAAFAHVQPAQADAEAAAYAAIAAGEVAPLNSGGWEE